ncbi:MAG TPA: dienelactone hydrolase family protein [Xanthomonadaceae bacterium]|nr:dienelactone hydrolase family protein [Xanthomonadaceae bacterium]
MDTRALLETVEHETAPDPRWAVVWLHGLGADGHDFAPIVPEVVQRGWPAIRFVFPHAPMRPVTINNGMRMRAWYDIRDLGFEGTVGDRADAAGVEASVAQVEALIARENERGIPSSRVLLAGFSQGGAIALSAALQRKEPLAGVVALSTYLPLASQTEGGATESATAQPVFMAHGTQDPVVPFAAGQRSAERLRAMGFDVEWHAYPMQHQVCGEQIRDLAQWVGRRFAA